MKIAETSSNVARHVRRQVNRLNANLDRESRLDEDRVNVSLIVQPHTLGDPYRRNDEPIRPTYHCERFTRIYHENSKMCSISPSQETSGFVIDILTVLIQRFYFISYTDSFIHRSKLIIKSYFARSFIYFMQIIIFYYKNVYFSLFHSTDQLFS